MEEQVRKAIEDVRPSLQADGGDVKFVGMTEDGVVSVQLQGACNGCPMAQLDFETRYRKISQRNCTRCKIRGICLITCLVKRLFSTDSYKKTGETDTCLFL